MNGGTKIALMWDFVNLPGSTSGVLDLSQLGVPECRASMHVDVYTGPVSIEFDVLGRGAQYHSITTYGKGAIELGRDTQGSKAVLSVKFTKNSTDMEEVKDWIELLRSDPEAKLLGTISATAMTLWTHVDQLFNHRKRYFLTPAFPSPEVWLCHGLVHKDQYDSAH